jgi:ribosomal protein S18 acetylase RimI-like enzyme
MVHPDARRQGIGEALMRALEAEACQLGKRLLVLDTNTDSAAQRLYTRLGWELCGVMPAYAEQADGSLGATSWMFKRL